MLNKYINKKVEITEKLYNYSSTTDNVLKDPENKITGTITAIDDDYIELDSNTLIAIRFIYRIRIID